MSFKLAKQGEAPPTVWVTIIEGLDPLRFHCRALTSFTHLKARAKSERVVAEIKENAELIRNYGGAVADLPDFTDQDGVAAFTRLVFTMALAEQVVFEWEGMLEHDDSPAPCDAAHVGQAVLQIPAVAEQFAVQYLAKQILRISEGKDLGALLDGSSDEAPHSATTADSETSPVGPENGSRPEGPIPRGSCAPDSNIGP